MKKLLRLFKKPSYLIVAMLIMSLVAASYFGTFSPEKTNTTLSMRITDTDGNVITKDIDLDEQSRLSIFNTYELHEESYSTDNTENAALWDSMKDNFFTVEFDVKNKAKSNGYSGQLIGMCMITGNISNPYTRDGDIRGLDYKRIGTNGQSSITFNKNVWAQDSTFTGSFDGHPIVQKNINANEDVIYSFKSSNGNAINSAGKSIWLPDDFLPLHGQSLESTTFTIKIVVVDAETMGDNYHGTTSAKIEMSSKSGSLYITVDDVVSEA